MMVFPKVDAGERSPHCIIGVATAYNAVRDRIAAAEALCNRRPGSVRLLAVSKANPPESVREAYAVGQRDFGESYVQEAVAKMGALEDLAITWHFIGPIQSNKTRSIATHFDWVHSLDRLKIARRLSEQRDPQLPPLSVCLQINLSGDKARHGVRPQDAVSFATAVSKLPRLRLRGLMAVPPPALDIERQRIPFRQLHDLLRSLRSRGLDMDTLSMGMTNDMEAAIAEGATIVRIGTAIFGRR